MTITTTTRGGRPLTISAVITALLLALSSFSVAADDYASKVGGSPDDASFRRAMQANTAEAYYRYREECEDCKHAREALIRIQELQHASNGASLGAVVGSGAETGDDAGLYAQAKATNTAENWHRYLTNCSICANKAEALCRIQEAQIAGKGRALSDIRSSTSADASSEKSASDASLYETARESGGARQWFLYLDQCTTCSQQREALAAVQEAQFASKGRALSGVAKSKRTVVINSDPIANNPAADTAAYKRALATGPLELIAYRRNCSLCSHDEAALTALQNKEFAAFGVETASATPQIDKTADLAAFANAEGQGTAAGYRDYLLACQGCENRQIALTAMQELQYRTEGNALNSSEEFRITDAAVFSSDDSSGSSGIREVADRSAEIFTAEVNEYWSAAALEDGEDTDSEGEAEEAVADATDQATATTDETDETDETAADDAAEETEIAAETDAPAAETEADETADTSTTESAPEVVDETETATADEPDEEAPAEVEMAEQEVIEEAEEPAASAAVTVSLGSPPATTELHQTLDEHSRSVWRLAFAPSGSKLASASSDRSAIIWDAVSNSVHQRLTGHRGYVGAVAFSADGAWLATGAGDEKVRLWKVSEGSLGKTLSGHNGEINAVAFSADSQKVASGSDDQKVIIWDATSGSKLHTLEGHSGGGLNITWAPGSSKLVSSSSSDGTILEWDANTGAQTGSFEGSAPFVFALSFSPNGELLASGGSDNIIRLWNPSTRKLSKSLKGHSDDIRSVSFSADGKYLASGSADGSVRVWSLASGKQLTKVRHGGGVYSVAFSADGRLLASTGGSKTVKVWAVGEDVLNQD